MKINGLNELLGAIGAAEQQVASAADQARELPGLKAEVTATERALASLEAQASEARQALSGEIEPILAQFVEARQRLEALPAALAAPLREQLEKAEAETKAEAEARLQALEADFGPRLAAMQAEVAERQGRLAVLEADPAVAAAAEALALREQAEAKRVAEVHANREKRERGLRARLAAVTATKVVVTLAPEEIFTSYEASLKRISAEARESGFAQVAAEAREALRAAKAKRAERLRAAQREADRKARRAMCAWSRQFTTGRPDRFALKTSREDFGAVVLEARREDEGAMGESLLAFTVIAAREPAPFRVGQRLRPRDLPRDGQVITEKEGCSPPLPAVSVPLRFWRAIAGQAEDEAQPVAGLAEAIELLQAPRRADQLACGLQEQQEGEKWVEFAHNGLTLADIAVLFRARSREHGSSSDAVRRGCNAADGFWAAQHEDRLVDRVTGRILNGTDPYWDSFVWVPEAPVAPAAPLAEKPRRKAAKATSAGRRRAAKAANSEDAALERLAAELGIAEAEAAEAEPAPVDELALLCLPPATDAALRAAGIVTVDAVKAAVADLDGFIALVGEEAADAVLDLVTAPAPAAPAPTAAPPTIALLGIPEGAQTQWTARLNQHVAPLLTERNATCLTILVDGQVVEAELDGRPLTVEATSVSCTAVVKAVREAIQALPAA